MKKLVSLLMVLSLLLGVCACASAEEKTYNIGILQLIQHPALDQATQGFKDALTEKLGDKVIFDEGNASGDSNNCAQIAGQLVSKQVDLIMAAWPSRGARSLVPETFRPVAPFSVSSISMADS